ncbi:MAG: CDP-alcohol phosphatidyltransferase family protein [Planctomycetota bacterium]|jgi:phosphatidylglycerophosphate synthase
MKNHAFGGDKKLPMNSLLARSERRFIDNNVHRFPRWIEGYHLTLTTLLWSIGLIVFGRLARDNHHWLWGSSLMLFLQWFTDSFDGALGRYRDTGIPKWGYYMDHLLDFVFMSSVLIGYSFLLDGSHRQMIYLFIPISGCFMVSSYLAFGATNEFKITYLGTGPTEVRIYFIILNSCIILFGVGWIEKIIVYLFVASMIVLSVIIYRTQKYIWRIDMAEKSKRLGR